MTGARASVPTARDWRLVAPASGAWAAAATALAVAGALADPAARRAWAILVAACAVTTLAVAVTLLTRRGERGARRLLAGAVGLGLAAGGGSAAAHVHALAADPLAGWAGEGVVGRAVVRIDGDPQAAAGRTSGSWRSPDSVRLRGQTREVNARGRTLSVSVPVDLRLGSQTAPPADGTVVELPVRMLRGRATESAATLVATGDPVVRAPPGPVAAGATALRQGLRDALVGRDADAAALVAGLAVGDESGQGPELTEAMRASGLSHLTAVSGGNVAIVLVTVLALARVVGLRRRSRAVVAAAALAGFVVLVRPEPSVLRAAAMGAVTVIALAVGGRRRAIPALAAAVLVLVVAMPVLAVSYGFALSVAATAGLVLVAEPLRLRLSGWRPTARWPPVVLDAAAVTLAAQLATAPLVAALGGGISLAAVPANLLAMPAVAPVTVLGLGTAVAAPLSPPLAALVAAVAAVPAGWIVQVATRCAALPLAVLPWPEGLGGGLLLAGVVLAVAALRGWWRRGGRRPRVETVRSAALVSLSLAVVLVLRPPDSAGWPPPDWRLVVCDVGQGDAAVVRTGPGRAVVVDAGPDPDAVDRCLRDLGVDQVSALLLTHFHADHVEGVPGVLRGRVVGSVLVSPLAEPPEQAARVAGWVAARGLVPQAVTAGDTRVDGDVTWRALWPRRIIRGSESVPNNASVALLVDAAGLRVLLTGDVEPGAQVGIAAAEAAPGVDVVKVPHHGSRYQWPGLVTWAGAEVALVSVGAGNDYGHPATETLAAYRAGGAVVARTDEHGDLAVVLDDEGTPGLVTRR